MNFKIFPFTVLFCGAVLLLVIVSGLWKGLS